MRMLIVEDEVKMAGLIRRGLLEEGHAADIAANGEVAIWMAGPTEYDAIVLDVMLPGIDGFEVCRRFREAGVWAPVLMLTARDSVEDRIAGLDTGADDYLTKPFSFAELLARLRALVRRGPVGMPPLIEVGALRLDPRTHQVWRGEEEIQLSQKEFALVETLMRRPGQVVSRYDLLEHAWDYSYENRSNIIDVYIRYLCEKIDQVPLRVETVAAEGVLDLVATRFAARAVHAGRAITVEPSPLTLEADPLPLGQALGNLVDNALRHGGGTIHLFARREAGRIEFPRRS